jgi:hypothetical protein
MESCRVRSVAPWRRSPRRSGDAEPTRVPGAEFLGEGEGREGPNRHPLRANGSEIARRRDCEKTRIGLVDRDPDTYGIRALESCRARQNRCSMTHPGAGRRPARDQRPAITAWTGPMIARRLGDGDGAEGALPLGKSRSATIRPYRTLKGTAWSRVSGTHAPPTECPSPTP